MQQYEYLLLYLLDYPIEEETVDSINVLLQNMQSQGWSVFRIYHKLMKNHDATVTDEQFLKCCEIILCDIGQTWTDDSFEIYELMLHLLSRKQAAVFDQTFNLADKMDVE